jgi:hypothetical protein
LEVVYLEDDKLSMEMAIEMAISIAMNSNGYIKTIIMAIKW